MEDVFPTKELFTKDKAFENMKPYKEDKYPAPCQFFTRQVSDQGLITFKTDTLKVTIPEKEGDFYYVRLDDG